MRAIAKAKDHLGLGRDTSEDIHRIHEELGLYLVCDGSRDPDGRWAAEKICEVIHREMGKHAAILTQYRANPTKPERVAIEKLLQDAVQRACAEIHQACFVEKTRKPSSSALGVVLFLGDYAISAHVGNTRLYLLRAGKALRLTRDHTYYEEMLHQLPKGSQVNPAFKKRLTRAIGDSESVPLATASIPLIPQDTLILCSNGLSDYLGSDASAAIAQACAAGGDSGALAGRLLEQALKNKSDDNITALVVQISDPVGTVPHAPVPIHRDARKQIELLRSLKILAGIRDDEGALLKVQSLLTVRHAKPGDIVVQQGSPSDEMFIQVSGKTEVRSGNTVIAHRGPGDVIGEMGFFDRRLRSATITAVEPTELLSIQRWEYDALVQKEWRLGYKILEAVVVALAVKLEESHTTHPPR